MDHPYGVAFVNPTNIEFLFAILREYHKTNMVAYEERYLKLDEAWRDKPYLC